MLLTITTHTNQVIEVDFPGGPADFAKVLGRYMPYVPTDFNCAEVNAANLTIVLTDTRKVSQPGYVGSMSAASFAVLLSHFRQLWPEKFNLADIAAANALYLDRNYLQQQ